MSELIKALAAALPDVEGASKDKVNPHFKKTYADLASVIDAIRPVTKHNLWFRQSPIEHSSGACIETFYVHGSGEELSAGKCYVPASKNDAQGFGSAMTYCRRYGLLAAFGIAPEDDDGNAASQSAPPKKVELISIEQLGELQGMMDGYGINVSDFLKACKIDKLPDLAASRFEGAKGWLNKKYDEMKGNQ